MDDYLLGDYYAVSLHPKYQFLNGNLENNAGYSHDKRKRKKIYRNLKEFILVLKLRYFYDPEREIAWNMESYISYLKYYNVPLE